MRGAIRPPAVAGSFYPEEAEELATAVDGYVGAGRPAPLPGRLEALIAPHAGYVYSGPVAGTAYRLLRDTVGPRVRRVVLLGPAHHVLVRGVAGPGAAAMATPLGAVPVDSLTDGVAVPSPEAHAPEHSLEVHLPFLQRVLPSGFTVVPLLVGHASPAEVADILEQLRREGGSEGEGATFVVISSDLSHYLPYERARATDEETAREIEALDVDALESEQACGAAPVRGLLLYARRRGLRCQCLDLRSSGDTAGDRRRVVGYGAFALMAVHSPQ